MGKPFFTFGTEPPACRLQCWSLEPYLKQWLLQEQSTRNMPGLTGIGKGAFIGSLVRPFSLFQRFFCGRLTMFLVSVEPPLLHIHV